MDASLTNGAILAPIRRKLGVSMDGVPALCQDCGELFLARSIFGGNGRSVIVMTGNKTRCPVKSCGGVAALLDGEYEYDDGELSLLKGSRFTREQIAKLTALSAEIGARGLTDDILAAADAVAPEVGQVLRLAQKNKWRALAIAALLTVTVRSCSGESGPITINIGPQTTVHQTVEVGQFALSDPYKSQENKGSGHAKTAGKSTG